MVLKVLGSSSKGNCYLLSHRGETLVIEAGVPLLEVKKHLMFDTRGITACLVSHRHDDHARHIADFLDSGIRVLAARDVFEHKGLDSSFAHRIVPMKGYKIGNFKVLPIEVCHDVPCLAFIIDHPAMGKTFFATDTMMIEYKLPAVNHIMIEANYADDILERNIGDGSVHPAMRNRLLATHMEIETVKGVLRSNDISAVNEIVLLHLSADNSHAERFASEIAAVAGKPTYVAVKGLQLDFNIYPY